MPYSSSKLIEKVSLPPKPILKEMTWTQKLATDGFFPKVIRV